MRAYSKMPADAARALFAIRNDSRRRSWHPSLRRLPRLPSHERSEERAKQVDASRYPWSPNTVNWSPPGKCRLTFVQVVGSMQQDPPCARQMLSSASRSWKRSMRGPWRTPGRPESAPGNPRWSAGERAWCGALRKAQVMGQISLGRAPTRRKDGVRDLRRPSHAPRAGLREAGTSVVVARGTPARGGVSAAY